MRSFPTYALFSVIRGPFSASVDVGSGFRVHEPVILSVGPVIHNDDAVGNKAAALFSRTKVRDYLDAYGISPEAYSRVREELASWSERINAETAHEGG